MSKKLQINSIIDNGKYKGQKVSDLVKNKKIVFSLIKDGIDFDDTVLSLAGIKRNIRDVKVKQVLIEHDVDTRTYAKETTSLQKILKELRTLDNVDDENLNSFSNTVKETNSDDITDIEDL